MGAEFLELEGFELEGGAGASYQLVTDIFTTF